MESIEIESFFCPKCNRVLKPSIETNREHITWRNNKEMFFKVDSPDVLVCRYCNVLVKVSVLEEIII